MCDRYTGISITVTSLSNFIGFIFGMLIPIPAIANFCAAAAIVVGCNYTVLLFAIPALLAIQSHTSVPALCCSSDTVPGQLSSCVAAGSAALSGFYDRILQRPLVKVGALALMLGMLTLAVVGAIKLEDGLPLADVVPEGTRLGKYIELQENDFDLQTMSIIVQDVQYQSTATQRKILNLQAALAKLPYLSGMDSTWLSKFLEWLSSAHTLDHPLNPGSPRFKILDANGLCPPELFYPLLRNWTVGTATYLDAYEKDVYNYAYLNGKERAAAEDCYGSAF